MNVSRPATWALVAVFSTALLLRGHEGPKWSIGDFRHTHWFFNYELEFVKRGLLGEILRCLDVPVTKELTSVLSYGVLLLVAVALVALFSAPLRRSPKERAFALFFVLSLAHSGTLQHFSFDVGRYDSVSFLLALAAIGLTASRSALAAPALVGLLAVSILVHEASLVMFVPLVLALWAHSLPSRASPTTFRARLPILAAGAFLTVLGAAVGHFGRLTSLPYRTYFRMLRDAHGTVIRPSAVKILFSTTRENVLATLERLNLSFALSHLALLVVLLPTALFLYRFATPRARPPLDRATRFVLASALSPLLLYPVAHDHYRWWSLASTNLLVAIAVLGARSPDVATRLRATVEGSRKLLWSGVALSLLAGPFGTYEVFPRCPLRTNVALLDDTAELLRGTR